MFYHRVWLILQRLKKFIDCEGLKNIEDLRTTKGFIIVSNHAGITDPLKIGLLMPDSLGEIHWLAAIELFKFKDAFHFFLDDEEMKMGIIKSFFAALISATLVKNSLTLPVDRSAINIDTFSRAYDLLDDGQIIGIFPEGKVVKKKNEEINPGFVRMAKRAKVPILPVYIDMENNKVIFGKLINVPAKIRKKEAKKMAEDIMLDIYNLGNTRRAI